MMSLVGLTDDYAHDGRVLIEVDDRRRGPGDVAAASGRHFGRLASTYKEINAPMGTLGMKTLPRISTDRDPGQRHDVYRILDAQLKAIHRATQPDRRQT